MNIMLKYMNKILLPYDKHLNGKYFCGQIYLHFISCTTNYHINEFFIEFVSINVF